MTLRTVGPYALEERLGAGGMGEVWVARHGLLGRLAAVKLIDPSAGGADRDLLLERLMREAQATSMLVSEHTVSLYDFGIADDGSFYAAMELLDGFDVKTLVERFGPLPAARAVPLLLQICESLAEAHERGLVHRDIKPANLFVCRRGRKVDFVKVLDFGLVKLANAEESHSGPRLTATHTLVGSPAFMAPEMLTPALPVDGRADLYALGCVAFYLLSGELVFEYDHALDMMLAHRTEVPPDLAARLPPGVAPELIALIERCLHKEPEERFPDADALAAALRAVPSDGDAWDAQSWWADHHEPHHEREPTPKPGWTSGGEVLRRSDPVSDTLPLDALPQPGERSAVHPPIPPPDGRGPAWANDPGVGEHGGVTTAKAIGWALAGASAVLVVIVGAVWMSGVGQGPPSPSPKDTAPDTDSAAKVLPIELPEAPAPPVEPDPDVSVGSGSESVQLPDAPPPSVVAPVRLPSTASVRTPPADPVQDAPPDEAPEPEPESGSCAVQGEITTVQLRDTDGARRRCDGEIESGDYTVWADFGEGITSTEAELHVPPGGTVTIVCNPITFTCDVR